MASRRPAARHSHDGGSFRPRSVARAAPAGTGLPRETPFPPASTSSVRASAQDSRESRC
jgi:hypothetical protein